MNEETTTGFGSANGLLEEIRHHIMSYLGNDTEPPRRENYYYGLSLSVRDRLVERWIKTQRATYAQKAKRLYYLSMEFLPGRFLINNCLKLNIIDQARQALTSVGLDLEEIEEEEWDAGLGNGGLGRLASCYLDSMATLGYPGYGCGIRYAYGIFYQEIADGYQIEKCDNWVRNGSAWEIKRRGHLYGVRFYGRTESYVDEAGTTRYRWVDAEHIMALACDFLIPGHNAGNVNTMRTWEAVSSREFNLDEFNEGDYIGAVEAKVFSENISKVLYPRDESFAGKELRLKQQYFFVAATMADILRRFKQAYKSLGNLPDAAAIQLNDTHPCIGIPELMRILLDEEGLGWEKAWTICTRTFAYTNHTVLPEALETWSVELMGRVLPRHLEIIREIDRRFRKQVEERWPGDARRLSRMAIIEAGRIRMAHLAIVGSHSVNGVSELHTRILRERLFQDFDALFPGRLINITNGITPRRWLMQANPSLTELINESIGDGWQKDLDRLRDLIPLATDGAFQQAWRNIKQGNKDRLARYIRRKVGMAVDPKTLFDVQVKRIHEYKRQLLNILRVVTLYHRVKSNPNYPVVPRTVIFGGKAAPGYAMAKLIIKLINSVARLINDDADIAGRLQVVFLPNYCVSQAEKIIPAAELSQQISTAGMEASGTGNMKFALNGALIIGTLDGANVEIMEEVGAENIFIFGLDADQIAGMRSGGYNPRQIYETDAELKAVLDMIGSGVFSPEQPDLFAPVIRTLLDQGDYYMVLADYRAYVETQDRVAELYRRPDQWAQKAIWNTANMGKFSSDRAVREYAEKIWQIKPISL